MSPKSSSTSRRSSPAGGACAGREHDHALAAAERQPGHGGLEGHRARQPQRVADRGARVVVGPHAAAAERRAARRRVDGDDRVEARAPSAADEQRLVVEGLEVAVDGREVSGRATLVLGRRGARCRCPSRSARRVPVDPAGPAACSGRRPRAVRAASPAVGGAAPGGLPCPGRSVGAARCSGGAEAPPVRVGGGRLRRASAAWSSRPSRWDRRRRSASGRDGGRLALGRRPSCVGASAFGAAGVTGWLIGAVQDGLVGDGATAAARGARRGGGAPRRRRPSRARPCRA